MPGLRGALLDYGPVGALAAWFAAVAIAAQMLSPDLDRRSDRRTYPIRIDLHEIAAKVVRFDSSGAHGATARPSTVEIRKNVSLNGADAGMAVIHVTSDSRLLLSRDEFRRILVGSGLTDLADRIGAGGLISFDDLRSRGVNVRFDPVSDRIVVTT